MNLSNEAKEIFEFRNSIVENSEAIIKYGNKFQKSNNSGQMSLFDSESIEIDKIELPKKELNEQELSELADKEYEALGFLFTYNIFDEYIIYEKVLCNSTFKDSILTPEVTGIKTFIAKVDKIEKKISKSNNYYYKVYMSRESPSVYAYLFGTNINKNIHNITPGKIHIVRVNVNDDKYSIEKIQECDKIDIMNYVDKVEIDISNAVENLDKIRECLYFNMYKDGKYVFRFVYNGDVVNNIENKQLINITPEIINKLIDYKCKIRILKKP